MAVLENYFGRIGRDFQKIWPNFISDSWEHCQFDEFFQESGKTLLFFYVILTEENLSSGIWAKYSSLFSDCITKNVGLI